MQRPMPALKKYVLVEVARHRTRVSQLPSDLNSVELSVLCRSSSLYHRHTRSLKLLSGRSSPHRLLDRTTYSVDHLLTQSCEETGMLILPYYCSVSTLCGLHKNVVCHSRFVKKLAKTGHRNAPNWNQAETQTNR